MNPKRLLRIGPHGPSLRDRTIAESPRGEAGLWIVSTELARDRLCRDLTWLSRGVEAGTVWTWDQLWDEVRVQANGPSRPSPAALRAVLKEAIDQEQRAGRLKFLGDAAESPGFRRRLQSRIASWTRAGRDPSGIPPSAERIDVEEWGIFGRYRRLLNDLRAEDNEGTQNWAASRFVGNPPPSLRHFHRVNLLEPPTNRNVQKAIPAFCDRSPHLTITLEYDDDASPREAYFEADAWRDQLLALGLEEQFVPPDPARPAGLTWLGQSLFRADLEAQSDQTAGLQLRGAPSGQGIGLIVARRVRDLLDAGADPEDILVVVPRLDDEADMIRQTLASCGVNAQLDTRQTLSADPVVSALRQAMMIAPSGWESSRLIRLLRNGNLRPTWSASLAAMADAIRNSHVYRGRNAIRDALRTIEAESARKTLADFDLFAAAIDACDRDASWSAQAERLVDLARNLGIKISDSVDSWLMAIDDHGEVRERLAKSEEIWSWEAFTREAQAIARETTTPPKPIATACVRVTSAALAEGASVLHLIVANMAEGTFPSRNFAGDEWEEVGGPLGREQNRFLRLIASARASLSLVYPTTDEKGISLSASGFLDDVHAVFTKKAPAKIDRRMGRLDPVLPENLAMAAAEVRVRAVHLACNEANFAALDTLLRNPAHRQSLTGVARSLRLAHWRSRRENFGRYDGQISDPRIRERIAAEFAPDRAVLSASHLETFALCPFQFFQKYVLKLEPSEDREDLDDDATARGSLLHKALEHLHALIRDTPGAAGQAVADRVDAQIGNAIAAMLASQPKPTSAIDAGLLAIESERLRRMGRKYVQQFRKYMQKDGLGAASSHFEVAFGSPKASYPALQIGEPPRAVALQGVIDRIDMVNRDGHAMFRVIDYKTGVIPSKKELESGEKLQLSLYALAAERVILADSQIQPFDAAYWDVRDKGFKPMQAMTTPNGDAAWSSFTKNLEKYILELVDRLRHADFPVSPRPDDCMRLCDYQFVCRVAQVKRAGKSCGDLPRLGAAP